MENEIADWPSDYDRADSIPRYTNADDIAMFTASLAAIHACRPGDVAFHFEPVETDEGNLDTTLLRLVFRMRAMVGVEYVDKVIYSINVRVPREVQSRAEELIRNIDAQQPSK